jgi:hypothetical protein
MGFYSTFEEQLSHQHPLYILAHKVEWEVFEKAFQNCMLRKGVQPNLYA